MIIKFPKLKFFKYNSQKGMTYVELIVVLSIFSIMSGMIMFNYRAFQDKVDIKNLANDIALNIVQAQKDSTFGKLPSVAVGSNWKPSYGIYIDIDLLVPSNNKSFIYFIDLDNDNLYDTSTCPAVGECINQISITKGNYISDIDVYYQSLPIQEDITDITLSFVRPSTTAIFESTSTLSSGIDYVQINIISPSSSTSNIKIYASGRIQLN